MVPLEESLPLTLMDGLPVHPLAVHAAVVLVPLTALGVILMVFSPRFGARFGSLISVVALIAVGGSYLATESGEQLETLIGAPGYNHAEWGEPIPLIAAGLLLACVVVWLVQRSRMKGGGSKVLSLVVGLAALVMAGVSMFWTYQAGHTGAQSVWTAVVAER